MALLSLTRRDGRARQSRKPPGRKRGEELGIPHPRSQGKGDAVRRPNGASPTRRGVVGA
jgi:hypothetical protein